VATEKFNPQFVRLFFLACFFKRFLSWSEYPKPPSLALGRQSGDRLSQGQCFFSVEAEALGDDRRPQR